MSWSAAPPWRLTFQEEFKHEGEVLNAWRWNAADQMGRGVEELQLCVNDKVYLANGELV